MIEITQTYRGFTIRYKEDGFGSYSFPAANIEEVKLAVEHYYLHSQHATSQDCPICRGDTCEEQGVRFGYRAGRKPWDRHKAAKK